SERAVSPRQQKRRRRAPSQPARLPGGSLAQQYRRLLRGGHVPRVWAARSIIWYLPNRTRRPQQTMPFELLRDFASVSQVTAQPNSAELFDVLSRFRQAVRGHEVGWSDFEPIQQYAGVCFWAIRKLEYSFAAEAFAAIERPHLKVLDVGCGVVPLCNWV